MLQKIPLTSVSFAILIGFTVLLPIFFVPALSLDVGKGFLFSFFTLAIFLVFLVTQLKDGVLIIPKRNALLAGALFAIAFTISSLATASIKSSFLGIGSEVSTASFILLGVLLIFLSSAIFSSPRRVSLFYYAYAGAFSLVALFEFVHLFFPAITTFGIFSAMTENPVGKWHDMGIFFGAGTLFSLVVLELFAHKRLVKILSWIFLTLSFFFVLLVNVSFIFALVALGALIVLAYIFSIRRVHVVPQSIIRLISLPTLAVLLLSIAALLPGNFARFVPASFSISHFEVRPSLSSTISIAKNVFLEDPILGTGPARFFHAWALYKPTPVNQTIFGNTDFEFGIGALPTYVITGGVVSGILLLLFLFIFAKTSAQAFLREEDEMFTRRLLFLSFLLSAYLWIAAIVYVPNITIFTFAFLFTGATLALFPKKEEYRFSLLAPARGSFFVSIIIIGGIVLSVAGIYLSSARFFASLSFMKGISSLGTLDTVSAEKYISRADRVYAFDLYERALAELRASQVPGILSRASIAPNETLGTFRAAFGASVEAAERAVLFDPTNYLNRITLGNVYHSITMYGIEGAYENARSAYGEAEKLYPNSPALALLYARLELAHGDSSAAREFIAVALARKQNYTEAIFLLSQIEAAEGNLAKAILETERTSFLAPDNVGVFFQLGILRYRNGDYVGAVAAFERAVALNPVYANAKYFLGLSYSKLGNTALAIVQFEDVLALNPGNSEVEKILQNLRAEQPPFFEEGESSPEKRENLPVRE